MHTSQQISSSPQQPSHTSIFTGLLRGYRFRVCSDATSVARALDVRRSVYVAECGYDIPVPDAYDARSWFLIAEHLRSGEVVGSMRITPRAGGLLEAEEYFSLPPYLRTSQVVEVTRFAILPPYRKSKRFLPVVAMGLFKLACNFVDRLGVQYVVVCAKPERVWTYQWLKFEPVGISAPYTKLGGQRHELLEANLRGGITRHRDHRYWEFFFEIQHGEVSLPNRIPKLGLLCGGETMERPALRRMA
jgi:N-acyl-L-homoserine lactone synthetase